MALALQPVHDTGVRERLSRAVGVASLLFLLLALAAFAVAVVGLLGLFGAAADPGAADAARALALPWSLALPAGDPVQTLAAVGGALTLNAVLLALAARLLARVKG
ncbi:MAG: hypothetical protein ACOY4K_02645 [Pseudomonadota bacterium]